MYCDLIEKTPDGGRRAFFSEHNGGRRRFAASKDFFRGGTRYRGIITLYNRETGCSRARRSQHGLAYTVLPGERSEVVVDLWDRWEREDRPR